MVKKIIDLDDEYTCSSYRRNGISIETKTHIIKVKDKRLLEIIKWDLMDSLAESKPVTRKEILLMCSALGIDETYIDLKKSYRNRYVNYQPLEDWELLCKKGFADCSIVKGNDGLEYWYCVTEEGKRKLMSFDNIEEVKGKCPECGK